MIEKKNKDRLRRIKRIILQTYHHSIVRLIVAILLIALSGSILVNVFEKDPSSTITDLWLGLWWALVSITTTGYGDYTPLTTGGRIVAIIVMLSGIMDWENISRIGNTIFRRKKAILFGIGRETQTIALHDLLSDNNSYLDVFIRQKLEESGKKFSEEHRINFRINPPPDYVIEPNDIAIVIFDKF